MTENKYYVYHVLLEDEVVYVGKGCGDRYKHPLSGKSHNKYLNELYFRHTLLGESIVKVVIICDNLEEVDAYKVERDYIQDLLPKGNVALKPDNHYGDQTISLPDNYDDFMVFMRNVYSQTESRSVSFRGFVKGKRLSKVWEQYYAYIDMFLEKEPKGTINNGGHNLSFIGVHFKGDDAGKKACQREINRYKKNNNGERPDDDYLLAWKEIYLAKREQRNSN